ncbi:MFS transporter [Megasphaera sp. AM44-1BH]|jgi:ACS family tartrate transporter-like MFS transporter|uniref:MFS transporter n=1 Tax=Megasphaera sp. AM44-1BH TaxID=2292358 RepID=UPI000E511D07|nr:MFS transporter [Megasphaera sp. AM44-1BH]RHA15897.1 MFS transporter [Megasphaera sp. AM44-1BH]
MDAKYESIDFAHLDRMRKWHIIFPVFLVSVIAFLDRVNIAYAGMTMTQQLDWLTPEVFGAGSGMFFLGYFFFEIPGSLVAARFDACKWIARIMFTWGLVCGLLAFMQNSWQFYLFRFLLGACEASLYPVIYAVLFPRWFLAKERAAAISLMLTSLLIAAIIGSPIAGILLEFRILGFEGWQCLFLIEAVPALVFTFVFLFWVKDRPDKVSYLTPLEKEYLNTTIAAEEAAKESVKKYTIWQSLTDKQVWRLCVIYFTWITGFWGFNFWMPQVLKGVSGWSPSLVGFAIIFPMGAALIAQVLVGKSSSKTGEKRWHVAGCMFLGAVGLICAPFIHDGLLSLIFVSITAIGVYAPMGTWWSVPTTFLTGAAAAGATALINSIANLGGYVGPYMLGVIKQNTGSTDGGYFALGAMLIISGLVMLTLPKKTAIEEATEKEK